MLNNVQVDESDDAIPPDDASVRLYWLPLGAGGRSVRWSGRIFEAIVARNQGRSTQDLYHSALEVNIGADHFIIEMTHPVWGGGVVDRGVALEGSVGSRSLGLSKLFRYEIRCWSNGVIPDLAEAIDSPQIMSRDLVRARKLVELVPQVPALTWGRDESHLGEMWNSNSLISWLLARSDHEMDDVVPPANGRAPGWNSGLFLATQQSKLA